MKKILPGRAIFHNPRAVACDLIADIAYRADGRELVVLTRGRVEIFDADGDTVADAGLDGAWYEGVVRTCGELILVGARAPGPLWLFARTETGLQRRIDRKARDHRSDDEGEVEDYRAEDLVADDDSEFTSAYHADLRLTEGGIVAADSISAQWFDLDGAATGELDAPFHGPESWVNISPSGALLAWGNQDADRVVMYRRAPGSSGAREKPKIELIQSIDISIDGEGPLAFSSDDRLLAVASGEYSGLRVSVRDIATGREVASLRHGGMGSGVLQLLFSPDGESLVARTGHGVVCWSIDQARLRWVWRDFGPGNALAFHPGGERLAVCRGRRVLWLDLETGTRRAGHEGPAQPILELTRDHRGRVVARDTHRVYLFDQQGACIAERSAWCLIDPAPAATASGTDDRGHDADEAASHGAANGHDLGEVYALIRDRVGSVLCRTGQTGFEPVGKLGGRTDNPTTADVRGRQAVFPRASGEGLQLATRTGIARRVLDSAAADALGFVDDDSIATLSQGYDDLEGDYMFHQSLAVWSLASGEPVWHASTRPSSQSVNRDDLRGDDPVEFLSIGPEGIFTRQGGRVVAWNAATGEVMGRLELAEAALWAGEIAGQIVVIAGDGAVHRFAPGDGESAFARGALAADGILEPAPTAVWLDSAGKGLVALGCAAVHEIDLASIFGLQTRSEERRGFPVAAMAEVDDDEMLDEILSHADWRSFDPGEHFDALRSALERVETRSGLGTSHRRAARALRGLPGPGARLLHRHGHATEVIEIAVDRSGSYIATGSWLGDEYHAGGALQIWDARTGRVVNRLAPVAGGVGWPDYPRCIQWSPSGAELGVAHNTNSVGCFAPFAEAGISRVEAATTDGWSRPPGFAWSSKGDRIAISSWNERSFIPLCVVDVSPDRSGFIGEGDARWFAARPSGEIAGFEQFDDAPRTIHWSPADALVYGYNSGHRELFAVEVATGALKFVIDPIGGLAAWSPCGRWIAHDGAGLTLCDAVTGEVIATSEELLPEALGAALGEISSLRWTENAGLSRLAAVSENGLFLFEGEKFLAHVGRPEGGEITGLAWSPDGERAAWFASSDDGPDGDADSAGDGEGRGVIEIWAITRTPEREAGIATSHAASRLVWRTEDTILAIGDGGFAAYDVVARTRRYAIDLSIPGQLLSASGSPLLVVEEEHGRLFALDPAFPVPGALDDGRHQWALAFENGIVVCPPELREGLDDALSFSIDGRFALPARYGITAVHDDLASALPYLPVTDEVREALANTYDPAEPDPLPLGEPALFRELTEAHYRAVAGLSRGRDSHVSDALHAVASLHARRGEAVEAESNARRVLDAPARIMALADCAFWLARTGTAEHAAKLLAAAEDMLPSATGADPSPGDDAFDHGERDEYWQPKVSANLAAACHAVARIDAAKRYFTAAENDEFLAEESNGFQRYSHLAEAYLRVGDESKASDAIGRGPWDDGYADRFLTHYVVAACDLGFVDHALAVANRCQSDFDDLEARMLEAISDAMIAARRHDELETWLDGVEGWSTDEYRARSRRAQRRAGRGDEVAAALIERANASTWPLEVAGIMNELSHDHPDEVEPLLEVLVGKMAMTGMNRQDLTGMMTDIGEAMSRIGLADTAAILRVGFETPEEHLALLDGLLRGCEIDDEQFDGWVTEATELIATAMTDPKARVRAQSRLGVAVHAKDTMMGRQVFDQARRMATGMRGDDRRYALDDVLSAELEAGDLESAYATWLAHARHHRSHAARPLIEALGDAGEITAVVFLLEQLPARDDMNGAPQLAFRAVERVARRQERARTRPARDYSELDEPSG